MLRKRNVSPWKTKKQEIALQRVISVLFKNLHFSQKQKKFISYDLELFRTMKTLKPNLLSLYTWRNLLKRLGGLCKVIQLIYSGFPGGSEVRTCPPMQEMPAKQELHVESLGWEDPLKRKWQPTPIFLPGNTMDRGAWRATVQGVAKSRTWLSN